MTTVAPNMTNSQKLQEYTKIFQQQSKENLNYIDSSTQSANGLQATTSGAHYEVPNLASMLYDYTNKEQDRILQGFRVGNFVSLRDLPTDFTPGNVLTNQMSKIEQNVNHHPEPKQYVELQNGGGYFSKFEWKPDPFGLYLEQQREENQKKREKQEQLHGTIPFYSHPKKQILPKHISEFSTLQEYADHLNGFYGDEDPYEASRFEILREKWLSDSKMLYGDFKPAQGSQGLKQVNKQHLPEVVGLIKRNLLADWSNINFVIGTNPEDFIEMRFDTMSLDSPKGLHAYINNLVNTNEFLLKYQLRRVTEYWGIFSDDQSHIYYMLAPPYVKIKNPTLYLKQIQNISHPNEQ